MQHLNTCNNCTHFHADPEQEGVFGDCRKNAPVPMPQDIAGSQPGYSRVIYMGTWPAVFGDDVCSQYCKRATVAANAPTDTEVSRSSDKANGEARSAPVYEAFMNAICDKIDKHFDTYVEQIVELNREVDSVKALIANKGAKNEN